MTSEYWRNKIVGAILPFVIVGFGFLINRYIWNFADSLLNVAALLIIAGLACGFYFGPGATIYVTAAPSLILAGLVTLQDQFNIHITFSDAFPGYWLLAILIPFICGPLAVGSYFGVMVGQYVQRNTNLRNIRINWWKLRDWF